MGKDWDIGIGWDINKKALYSYPYTLLAWKGRPLAVWIAEAQDACSPGSGELDYELGLLSLVRAGRRAARRKAPVWEVIGNCSCGSPGCWDLEARVEVVDSELRILEIRNTRHEEYEYPFVPIVLPWPEFKRAVAFFYKCESWKYWGLPASIPRFYPQVNLDKLKFPEESSQILSPEREAEPIAQYGQEYEKYANMRLKDFFSETAIQALEEDARPLFLEDECLLADDNRWEELFYNHWHEEWGLWEFNRGDQKHLLNQLDWPTLETLRRALEQEPWNIFFEEWAISSQERDGSRPYVEVRLDLGDFPLRLQLDTEVLQFEAPFFNPARQALDWFYRVDSPFSKGVITELTKLHPGLGIRWGWEKGHWYWWDWLVAYNTTLVPSSARVLATYLDGLVQATQQIIQEVKGILNRSRLSDPALQASPAERFRRLFDEG